MTSRSSSTPASHLLKSSKPSISSTASGTRVVALINTDSIKFNQQSKERLENPIYDSDINTTLPSREGPKRLDDLGKFIAGNSNRKIMVAWNYIEYQVLYP